MTSSPLVPLFRRRAAGTFIALLFTATLTSVHAAKPNKDELRALKREGVADDTTAKPRKRDDSADPRPAKPNPAEAQTRQLDRLREKLEVTDDTEWALLTERISKVEEIRRTLWTNNANGRAALVVADKGKRAGGANANGNAERDALRSAVSDKLPDAEIKSRLTRAHEVQQQNEARLAQAQTDLRAILTIRQEAIMVMAGLLPP